MTRPKRNIVEYAAILTQRDLALSAAIEIVKNRLRHPVPSDGAEVVDANNSWRRDSTRRSRHGKVIVRYDEAGGYPTTCRNRREAKFSRQRADGRGSVCSFALSTLLRQRTDSLRVGQKYNREAFSRDASEEILCHDESGHRKSDRT
jgi:hypothetical protein